MTTLKAEASVRVTVPERHLRTICSRLRRQAAAVELGPRRGRITFAFGTGHVEAGNEALVLSAEAGDAASLGYVKASLALQVETVAAMERPVIVWTGSGSDDAVPANFRELRVVRITDLTARLRRITFAGSDLQRYGQGGLHARLLIPPPDATEPEWPRVGRNGLLTLPQGERRLDLRTYTIRSLDAASGELSIDFVLHEAPGPGAAFAARARTGDVVGILGPGGGNVGRADRYVLAGDETALPAIGRILEEMDPRARGVALVEVGDAGDRLPLRCPARVELHWLCRESDEAAGGLLARTVRDLALSTDDALFAWGAAEFQAFRKLRTHWRDGCGLGRSQHLAMAYWRRGRSEDDVGRRPS